MATPQQAIKAKTDALKRTAWPDIDSKEIWDRRRHAGFTTIPKTLPIIFCIMDSLSKGKPLSSTYLALWCRTWDDSFITINDPQKLAVEAGFSGNRAITTLKSRLKLLEELGFIESKTIEGQFSHILILNPHIVIEDLVHQGKINENNSYYLMLKMKDIELHGKGFTKRAIPNITQSIQQTNP